jgi:hypothetical protein
MTTGMGIFLLGPWIAVACAFASPSTTAVGLALAMRCALIVSAVGMGVTIAGLA